MTEHDIQRAAALTSILREIPKQLEAMAGKWESEAQKRRAQSDDALLGPAMMFAAGASVAFDDCAEQLRAYLATWEKP